MKYVMSDIHGEYDLFRRLLLKIEFCQEDKLYILGDVIDRGENSYKVLNHIMKSDNISLIRGNHEESFLYFLDEYWCKEKNTFNFSYEVISSMEFLHQNKTKLDSYLVPDEYHELIQLSNEELHDIHVFLKRTPRFVLAGKFFMCHAGISIPYDNISFSEMIKIQSDDTFLWIREEFYKNANRVKDKIILFGHTPTRMIDERCFKIWKNDKQDKIGLDCGAYFTGTLGCIRLDDMMEFYIQKNEL